MTAVARAPTHAPMYIYRGCFSSPFTVLLGTPDRALSQPAAWPTCSCLGYLTFGAGRLFAQPNPSLDRIPNPDHIKSRGKANLLKFRNSVVTPFNHRVKSQIPNI